MNGKNTEEKSRDRFDGAVRVSVELLMNGQNARPERNWFL